MHDRGQGTATGQDDDSLGMGGGEEEEGGGGGGGGASGRGDGGGGSREALGGRFRTSAGTVLAVGRLAGPAASFAVPRPPSPIDEAVTRGAAKGNATLADAVHEDEDEDDDGMGETEGFMRCEGGAWCVSVPVCANHLFPTNPPIAVTYSSPQSRTVTTRNRLACPTPNG